MSESEIQVLEFEINQERFAVPIKYVSEVVEVDEVEDYPNKNDNIIGITGVREKVVSVIDTENLLFDNKSNSRVHSMLLFREDKLESDKSIGFAIDSAEEVNKIPKDKIDNSGIINNETVKGIIKDENFTQLINIEMLSKNNF